MKLLLDFFPILAMFVAYKLGDFYTATTALMVCTAVQMTIHYAMHRKLDKVQKFTLVSVMLFGSLTLGLHDERFIKWKPTVVYTLMAIALAVGQWGFKKNPVKAVFGAHAELPAQVWGRLAASLVAFVLFLAVLNAWAATYLSTDAYMNFKLWGFAFPFVYFIGAGFYVVRHLPPEDGTEEPKA